MNKNLSTEPEQKSYKKRSVSFFTRQHTALFGLLVYDICPNNEKRKTLWVHFLSKAFLSYICNGPEISKGMIQLEISEQQEGQGDKPNEPLSGVFFTEMANFCNTLSGASFPQERSLFPFASSAADQFPWEMSKILGEYWTELKFLYVRLVKVPMGKPNLSWHVEYVNCFMAPKESIVRSPPLRVTPTPMSPAHWAKCWCKA